MRHPPRALLALLAATLMPGSAHAFSDPERFTAPSEEGGGAGRYFTGGPADGYSCAVCHQGGAPPAITLRGLPRVSFEPGTVYEGELRFDDDDASHALALELVDPNGHDVGLELPEDEEIEDDERCGATQEGRRASTLLEVDDRRILGVEACGARAVRFRFRAPKGEQALLVATVVRVDGSASPSGDGVTELVQPLFRRGTTPRTTGATGCALPSAPWPSAGGALALAVALALGRRSRRR